MSKDFGKTFEKKFKEDFLKVPNATIDRLYDVVMGYKSIKQISDYIGFIFPNIFYLECKTHKGASLPLCNISQYDNLCRKVSIKGVRSGVVLWLYEKDKVLYIPTKTITKLKENGEKSVGMRHLNSNYRIFELPSTKRRIFMDTDYTLLTKLKEGD